MWSLVCLSHSAQEHIKMRSDVQSFLIRFSKKFWPMYQKKEKKFLQETSPHLSHLLNVVMAHRNYFRQNYL